MDRSQGTSTCVDIVADAGDPSECAQLPPCDNVQVSHELNMERPLGRNKDGSALGEALYWMAEKLTWGYEDVEPDAIVAL